jgi:tetratricopeptide (TPR) repeat protein
MFQATVQEPDGKAVFEKFGIHATPTVLFLDPDGSEVDWIVGYSPPAEKYQERIDKVLAGTDTFKSISALYAKDPNNIEAVFKLAEKYSDRYNTEKANEMYKRVVALDPDGNKGSTEYGRDKVKVSYTQYAEFNIATGAISIRPPDPSLLIAFVKKYHDSTIVKDAYSQLSRFYSRQGSTEEATKFFEDYTKRFPEESGAYSGWVARILSDKEPVDQGISLAQKAIELSQGRSSITAYQALARLYLLKGEKDKAVEAADKMMKAAASPPAKPAARGEGRGGGESGAVPMPGFNPAATAAPMAAQIYIDAGRQDKALALFGPDFLKENMANSPILSRYAQFWAQQGQNLESALTAAKKVTELTPEGVAGYNTLSQVYLKMKNYPEALKAAEKALSLAPDQPPQIKAQIQKTIEAIKAAAAEKK